MISNIAIAGLTTVGFIVGLVADATNPPSALAGGGVSATQVLKADTLSKQQFDQQLKRLPDNAVIESKGQRMTKAQIRALAAQKVQQHQASAQAALNQARVAFQQRRAQLEQQTQAKLQADNVKAMADFTRLAPTSATPQARQLEAIQEEAAQLFQRSKTASPAELAQIEQRAAQLLQQLGR
ncbi:MAG: hypothetical protein ACREJ6_11825 [Candidatus Methylomirabilis sp.]